MKAGWKTTEFWGLVIIYIIELLNRAFNWDIPKEQVLIMAIPFVSYALSRTWLKVVEVGTNNELVLKEHKDGWKSTEFWAMIISAMIELFNHLFKWGLPKGAIVAIVVPIITYIFGRTWFKVRQVKTKAPSYSVTGEKNAGTEDHY